MFGQESFVASGSLAAEPEIGLDLDHLRQMVGALRRRQIDLWHADCLMQLRQDLLLVVGRVEKVNAAST